MSSLVLAGGRTCACRIGSCSMRMQHSCRPAIARTNVRHLESATPCRRSLASYSNPKTGKDSYRKMSRLAIAAFGSGAFVASLNLVDTEDDKLLGDIRGPRVARMAPKRRDTSLQIRFGDSLLLDHSKPRSSTTIAGAHDDEIVLLLPEDEESISPFLFYLMQQVELVRVQEDTNHQYLPIGLPGLGCSYCSHCASRRSQVFPLDRRTFPNMVRKQLYNHIRRCERCPLEVKLELRRLKKMEVGNKISREERLFFKELWFRMGHKTAI